MEDDYDYTRRIRRGRSKIFRSCFRSAGVVDEPSSLINLDDHDSKNGRSSKPPLIPAAGGESKVFSADNNFVNVADDVAGDCDVKQSSSSRGRLSRVFKPVLFGTAVKRRIRSKKSSKSSITLDINPSSIPKEKIDNSRNENLNGGKYSDGDDSFSRRSTLFSSSSRTASSLSSSCSSSINSSSTLLSDRKGSSQINSVEFKLPIPSTSPLPISNPGLIKFAGVKNLNIVLCLFFLVNLFVLVIWGRICAITCTSIGLYFFGRCVRIVRVDSPANSAELQDTNSEQYKKRVIMEGLLDRSRNWSR